jgi:serine/threonine protein kinase
VALPAGTRLGPYEILEPLGAGGMGEVYRARDTRLDRTVAVKVLPENLAADPQLKARFQREARAISALAHPNICTLHDVGEEDGQTFLVMEHLAGQTLAERLKKGPLSLGQALEVAAEIADALAAAHSQGIVHRDLKPSNVMLTRTGARLLDFGLAQLTAHGEQPSAESLPSAPTRDAPLTGQGTILGTLPYMAPEQVEGRPADARTDLWALGAVLYEMLTGRRPFDGGSTASLTAAILEHEPPPLSALDPQLPPALEHVVGRCLAKDADARWQTARDVANELEWISQGGTAVTDSGGPGVALAPWGSGRDRPRRRRGRHGRPVVARPRGEASPEPRPQSCRGRSLREPHRGQGPRHRGPHGHPSRRRGAAANRGRRGRAGLDGPRPGPRPA